MNHRTILESMFEEVEGKTVDVRAKLNRGKDTWRRVNMETDVQSDR